ncbi:hypothetical protein MNB_SV-5-1116 [hydrothermal vent metagenome]|uniref:Uncharacterized protein n=1 Tax=hydrothermal vent metagenome TaxID=652676 RepID=A0A1W1EEJ1_9ZZZZ
MNYYNINVKVNSSKKPNFFIGSTLRGTFGHFLKDSVCVSSAFDCQNCLYKEECIYYDYYESSVGYRSFRFDTKMKAESYDFSLYLFSNNVKEIRMILSSLHRMLNTSTITDQKLSFSKHEISLNGRKLLFDDKDVLQPFLDTPLTLTLEKCYKDISINIFTPLLIKDPESKFKKEIVLEDVLTSIYKRKCYFEKQETVHKLDYIPNYTLITSELKIVKSQRRSDRQGKYIPIEGVTGTLIVMGLDEKSFMLLKWGEILAVGNKTVQGQGIIKIKY